METSKPPGHCEIDGNEIAKELARSGSSREPIGPAQVLKLVTPTSLAVDSLYDKIQKALDWSKHSQLFINELNKKMADLILKLNRGNCKNFLVTVTDICPNGLKTGIMQEEDAFSHSCLKEKDKPEHRLCCCPAFSRLRRQKLSKEIVDVRKFESKPIQNILTFLPQISQDFLQKI